MPIDTNAIQGLLRELYEEPVAELFRAPDADNLFFRTETYGTFAVPTTAGTLTVDMIRRAAEQLAGVEDITGFSPDSYKSRKAVQEQSLITVPDYATKDPIQFDEEWV